jgi:hypothetical protein
VYRTGTPSVSKKNFGLASLQCWPLLDFSIQLPLAFLLLLGLAVVDIPMFLVFLPLLVSVHFIVVVPDVLVFMLLLAFLLLLKQVKQ